MTRRFSVLLNLIVVVALILPSGAALPPSNAAASSSPAPNLPDSGLYRTRITVAQPYDWTRLEKLGVLILEREEDAALALVDGKQLETLARLSFLPDSSDELNQLLSAQGPEKDWLRASLQPLVERGIALQAQKAAAEADNGVDEVSAQAIGAAEAELRAALAEMPPEQQAGVAASPSVDQDGDGLTDTQEGWWCTDPMNPDSDEGGIGTADGVEVAALKQWLANELPAFPATGKPFSQWPPQIAGCVDDDQDSVPDLVERWELGLNMNRESTDRDKFDDGQELFGLTYCPGSGGFCGYGALPRNEDWGVIFAEMPAWVRRSGGHPTMAAVPIPTVDVIESSFRMELVSTLTTDHVISEGTERSYSTAVTEGTSTSLADTTTWNQWQEVSETKPINALSLDPEFRNSVENGVLSIDSNTFGLKMVGGVATIAGIAGLAVCTATIVCGLAVGAALIGAGAYVAADMIEEMDEVQERAEANKRPLDTPISGRACYAPNACYELPDDKESAPSASFETQDVPKNGSGTQITHSNESTVIRPSFEIKIPVQRPTRTESQGSSWGGSQTTTTAEYEEHTITNGEAFSSLESWGDAVAVDSKHTADLWFTYRVRNTGTEYAREIGDLTFNLYIGDDPNPATTYFVANDIGGDGKLHNFMPGEEHPYTSARIPLSLEQMKAIDLGGPIRIVVEDFTYGIDELFYEDAVNSGVLIGIEDGTDDGDEAIDTYLIPTWGDELALDVLARYFPHTVDENGMMVAIWTPEYRADTPAWCAEPRVVGSGSQRTLWCKHALSTADWWNVYSDGMGDGSEGMQDTPASHGSVMLFRFNKDSDLDGYSDRSEDKLGTDANDPVSFPKPELIAGVHSSRSGNNVVATLSLLNAGLYDAYGVEAVMVAANDTISITNNTVGGSGRVRAQRQVIVGSRIALQSPLPQPWPTKGHATPGASGYYVGTDDRTYTFTAACANPAGCDVSAGTWSLNWNDGAGASGNLNFGGGYASPTPLAVGAFGLKLGMLSGKVYNGESFTVAAETPRDTFQYAIAAGHENDYTPPLVIVSYNDPQGNHRFVIPPAAMNLSSPVADLMTFSGQMLPDVGIEIATENAAWAGVNVTDLLLTNPSDISLSNAYVFLEFINMTGTVVSEVSVTVTAPPGPTVVPVTWDTAGFNPVYNPNEDYIVMAFWTDYQGNILDANGRPLSSFQADPGAQAAVAPETMQIDIGSVPKGQVVSKSFLVANTGWRTLKLRIDKGSPVVVRPQISYVNLETGSLYSIDFAIDTAQITLGDFVEHIQVHTSDPNNPLADLTVVGRVLAPTDRALAYPVRDEQPWSETVYVPPTSTADATYHFSPTVSIDDTIEPLFLFDSSHTLVGRSDVALDLASLATSAARLVAGPRGLKYQAGDGQPALEDIALHPDVWMRATGGWQEHAWGNVSVRIPQGWSSQVSGTAPHELLSLTDQKETIRISTDMRPNAESDGINAHPPIASWPGRSYDVRAVSVKGLPAWEAIAAAQSVEDVCRQVDVAVEDQWLRFQMLKPAQANTICSGSRTFDLILASLQIRPDLPAAAIENEGSEPIMKDSSHEATTATAPDYIAYSRSAAYNYAAGWWSQRNNSDGVYLISNGYDVDGAHFIAHVIEAGGFPIHNSVGQGHGDARVTNINSQRSYVLGTGQAVSTSAGGLAVGDIVYAYGGSYCWGGAVMAMSSGIPYLATHSVERWNIRYDTMRCGNLSMSFSFVHIDARDDSTPDVPTLYGIDNGDGDGNYSVNWSGASRATGYELVEQYAGGGWTSIYSGGDTGVGLGGRGSGNWCYMVRSYNGAGVSGWSNTACTTVRPFNPPGLYDIGNADGDGNFTVAWSGVAGAATYDLQRQFNYGGWTTVYSGGSTAVDLWGHESGIWCFIVRAANAGGVSGWSETKCTTVKPASAAWIYDIANADGDGNFTVSWSAVSGATGYELQQLPNGGAWARIFDGNATSFAVTGRGPGGWCYSVAAYNSGGSAGWSNTQCTTVKPANAPTLSAISNTDGDGAFVVAWSSVAGATSYDLQEQQNGGAWHGVYGGGALSTSLSGRTSGVWCYMIRALNTGGSSGWSAPTCTTVNTIPNPPIGLEPQANTRLFGRSVTLSWRDGGDPDNAPQPNRTYRVKVRAETGSWQTQTEWASATSIAITLPGDGHYFWNVQAFDGLGTSNWTPDRRVSTYSLVKQSAIDLALVSPRTTASMTAYTLQYGAHATFETPDSKVVLTVKLRNLTYASVSMDVLLAVLDAPGSLSTIDFGNDGKRVWTGDFGNQAPARRSIAGLADDLNEYLASLSVARNDYVVVPIGLQLNSGGSIILTNLVALPAESVDAAVSDLETDVEEVIEGETIALKAKLMNLGNSAIEGTTVIFSAKTTTGQATFLGVALAQAVAVGQSVWVTLPWRPEGLRGDVTITTVADNWKVLPDSDWNNNSKSITVTVRARPDLRVEVAQPEISEASAGQNAQMRVTVSNEGDTLAPSTVLALYDGKPNAGNEPVAVLSLPALTGGAASTATFNWTPAVPGAHQMFVIVDRDDVVKEPDETNNQVWQDVYIGFSGSLLIDSGGTDDAAYTPEIGYGYRNGQASAFCGEWPEQTTLRDAGGRIEYQFDHLLPGHFYHLDLDFFECDGIGRQQQLWINDNLLDSSIDLAQGDAFANGKLVRRTYLIDPALYTRHVLIARIQETLGNDAVLAGIRLYDVDYRYADAGGPKDVAYAAGHGYGWVDGEEQLPPPWGSLPYQTRRIDQGDSNPGDDPDNELVYRFDNLDPDLRYQLKLTFYQGAAGFVVQKIFVDGVDTQADVVLSGVQRVDRTIDIPLNSYFGDGSVLIKIRRTNSSTGAFVNEIALEQKTLLTLPAISQVQVGSVSDTRATVSWLSSLSSRGEVNYGMTGVLGQVGYDQRGVNAVDRTHAVTLQGLQPSTSYLFYVTAADAVADNGGVLYQFRTGPTLAVRSPDLAFGQVMRPAGVSPAGGAVVQVVVVDANGQGSPGRSAPMVALVDSGGYWNVDLGAARTADQQGHFIYSPTGDRIEVVVDDGLGCSAMLQVDTSSDAPVTTQSLSCVTQTVHTLTLGWNLLALNLGASPMPKAQQALDEANAQGGGALEIARWHNGGWDSHVGGYPFNDFTLELGRGYFIQAATASAWSRTGRSPSSPLTASLNPGWNLLGFPRLARPLKAPDLLNEIAAQGGVCTEAHRWANGAWMSHIKGYPFNQFDIRTDEGYFLKCASNSTYTPQPALALEASPWPAPITLAPVSGVADPVIEEVLVSNLRDVALTLSWRTDRPSTGWVEFGAGERLDQKAYDDRGEEAVSTLHHVTLTGLTPETAYAFRILSGQTIADAGGAPFSVKTLPATKPDVPLTAYGQVLDAAGQPAVGALVTGYLPGTNGERSEPLTTLVDGWGYWVLSLPEPQDCGAAELVVDAVGLKGERAHLAVPACNAQPAPVLRFAPSAAVPVYLPMVLQGGR